MPARITLTTDFGTRDAYVAQLKGVLYSQGPSELEVIDLTHDIAPQALREAALFVRAAWPRFPAETIHLVVVDPGVGSSRRALALEAHGQHWVGPDNGVMSLLFDGQERAVELSPKEVGVSSMSATFHGRDLFAPAAARLAHGVTLESLGSVARELVRLSMPMPQRRGAQLRGEIIHVDHYGNLISNITRAELQKLAGAPALNALRVRLGGAGEPVLPWVRVYAEAGPEQLVALIGSSEQLEIALPNGSAAGRTGAGVGSALFIE
jgi:S-adenosylmethionine hydrolase